MSDVILRETMAVVLREFKITLEFLKALKGGLFKGYVKERISNRIDGLEKAVTEIEKTLGGS